MTTTLSKESAHKEQSEPAAKHELAMPKALAADQWIETRETVSVYDASRVADGPGYEAEYQTELYYSDSDVVKVLTALAPAGEYEIWKSEGPGDQYVGWRAGMYSSASCWKTEPVLRVIKSIDGSVEVREFEPVEDVCDPDPRGLFEGWGW